MMCGDFRRKYVKDQYKQSFMDWGKWWDVDFSYWAFYDLDLLYTLLDYTKGK